MFGAADGELLSLRRGLSAALGPQSGGRSLTKLLLIKGVPSHSIAVAPLLRWAQECWNLSNQRSGSQTLPVLRRAWESAAPQACRSWAGVRGPLTAACLSARRLGWEIKGPFVWRDDNGRRLTITNHSPAFLAAEMRAARVRQLERRAAGGVTEITSHASWARRRGASRKSWWYDGTPELFAGYALTRAACRRKRGAPCWR